MTTAEHRTSGGGAVEEVDSLFRALVDDGDVPGLAYGIVDRGGLVHAAGHGVARLDGDRPDAATAFRIASMTKSFTAASIMTLAAEGAVRLDDPVGRYVPEFGAVRPPTTDSPQVTVGMLLSMAGGLPTDDPWADRQESMSREEFGRLLTGGVRFVSVPGTGFEYSNLGYAVLGRVIEAASGTPYHEFVERRLLRPLGLTATGFDTSVAAPSGVATGHSRLDGRWHPEAFSDPGVFSAIGGLFSTVEDLARWMRWLADAFPARDGADDGPLRRASRRDMQQVHRAVSPPRPAGRPGDGSMPVTVGYGYGLMIQQDPVWGTVVAHSGGYPGFGSHMRWHLRTGLGVVVLTNARYSTGRVPAAAALRAVLADLADPQEPVALWPETAEARAAVEGLLRGWDPDAAAAWFAGNVDLDLDLGRRRARIESLVGEVGPLLDPAEPKEIVRSDSPAHVIWDVRGARGVLRCEIRLNPQDPPRIQTLDVTRES
ncbi:serine hydrolase domain-containing protein [Actinoallomurus soli]|uniref:serine hydrolase domain-containing protein n=1 Tax=Actinoallomurus soli TaxID=2952535 RepID=UPI0020921914|nr:serine hydrolase domain-containing protein [Actinoallomurus soli]MCO5971234.1 beta-lactamase family protein [Actinoallomurus soli]